MGESKGSCDVSESNNEGEEKFRAWVGSLRALEGSEARVALQVG
jgi:hypothetical protein